MKNLFDNWRTSFLVEARIDDLIAKYPDDEKVIRYLSDNDPAGNDKYLKWMHKQFLKSVGSPQIIAKVAADFHKNRQRLDKKDIYQWDFNDLKGKLDGLGKTNKQKKEEDAIKVYEDDEWLFVIPTTKKMTCTYGSNTKWCITMTDENHWEDYIGDGVLFLFIINKMLNSDHSNSKWAIAYMPRSEAARTNVPWMQIFDAKDNLIARNYVVSYEILSPRIGEDKFNMIEEYLKNEYDALISKMNLPDEKALGKLLNIAERLDLKPKIVFYDNRNDDHVEVTHASDLKYSNFGRFSIEFEVGENSIIRKSEIDYISMLIKVAEENPDFIESISFKDIKNSKLINRPEKNLMNVTRELIDWAASMSPEFDKDSVISEIETIGDIVNLFPEKQKNEGRRLTFDRFLRHVLRPAGENLPRIKAHKLDFKYDTAYGKNILKYSIDEGETGKEQIEKCTDNLLKLIAYIKHINKKLESDPIWSKINELAN